MRACLAGSWLRSALLRPCRGSHRQPRSGAPRAADPPVRRADRHRAVEMHKVKREHLPEVFERKCFPFKPSRPSSPAPSAISTTRLSRTVAQHTSGAERLLGASRGSAPPFRERVPMGGWSMVLLDTAQIWLRRRLGGFRLGRIYICLAFGRRPLRRSGVKLCARPGTPLLRADRTSTRSRLIWPILGQFWCEIDRLWADSAIRARIPPRLGAFGQFWHDFGQI